MNMEDYEIVLRARADGRLTATDYIDGMISEFIELHGDRLYADDRAVIGGIGFIRDLPVTVIGIEKGKNIRERIDHNFGSAGPEGYRKALRLMKQAEKFKRPVMCIVDTAGAFCGVEAEEHGQGRAIADNLFEMSTLKVPILSIVIGEGGSGGALALAHADRIWMLEDAYFSVVSPENCANILWKDAGKAADAAKALSLTAEKLYRSGLIDEVIKGTDFKALTGKVHDELVGLLNRNPEDLVEDRYRRFRKVGY